MQKLGFASHADTNIFIWLRENYHFSANAPFHRAHGAAPNHFYFFFLFFSLSPCLRFRISWKCIDCQTVHWRPVREQFELSPAIFSWVRRINQSIYQLIRNESASVTLMIKKIAATTVCTQIFSVNRTAGGRKMVERTNKRTNKHGNRPFALSHFECMLCANAATILSLERIRRKYDFRGRSAQFLRSKLHHSSLSVCVVQEICQCKRNCYLRHRTNHDATQEMITKLHLMND